MYYNLMSLSNLVPIFLLILRNRLHFACCFNPKREPFQAFNNRLSM